MNILFIKHFFVGFMVSEIPRVSVFGHYPYSVIFPYIINYTIYYSVFASISYYSYVIRIVNISNMPIWCSILNQI